MDYGSGSPNHFCITGSDPLIHDELNFSVLPEEKDRVERIVIEEMQQAIDLRVPLVADSGFGANWLEAH